MPLPHELKRIRLNLARSKEFPSGSNQHGYEFVAPLDHTGHIDAALWRRYRDHCRVRRRGRDMARCDWSPFDTLQPEIDRLFAEFGRYPPIFRTPDLSRPSTPTIDVTETDKEIEITAELPGLEEKDVEVNVANNVLTIRGEKKAEKEDKAKSYHVVERSYGAFARTFELPGGIDAGAIKAATAKGVLKVTVPKPAPAVTKKVEIKSAA